MKKNSALKKTAKNRKASRFLAGERFYNCAMHAEIGLSLTACNKKEARELMRGIFGAGKPVRATTESGIEFILTVK